MGPRESQPCARLAKSLGMNAGAVNVAVHRLRKRYRALVRAEIANTLGPGEEVGAEMRHLFQVLAD
jgi:RNA polymerase sigma-70 factor (ECF subfamily)